MTASASRHSSDVEDDIIDRNGQGVEDVECGLVTFKVSSGVLDPVWLPCSRPRRPRPLLNTWSQQSDVSPFILAVMPPLMMISNKVMIRLAMAGDDELLPLTAYSPSLQPSTALLGSWISSL